MGTMRLGSAGVRVVGAAGRHQLSDLDAAHRRADIDHLARCRVAERQILG